MIKKILFGLACIGTLTACNENFEDWADPQTNPEPTVVSFGDGGVSADGVIDMAAIDPEQSDIKVCSILAPTASKEGFHPIYKINLGSSKYDLSYNGEMLVEELSKYLTDNGILRPVETPIAATVEMWLYNGVSSIKTATSGEFNITVKPKAPIIESAYYVTGTPNGWNNADKTYELTNGGSDVYANPVFTCLIPSDGSDIEFKITPASGIGGDWSECLCGSDEDGKFLMHNVGGNFFIPGNADAKFVKLSFDMMNMTWKYEYLAFDRFLWVPGDTNGWSHTACGRIESAKYDGIYEGYIYMGGGFKFTSAADWGHKNYGWGADSRSLSDDGGAGNLWLGDDAALYYVKVDLVNMKYEATKIENMNLVGDFNGWNAADDAQQMTWDADNLCFVKTGAGVNANGWKFTANNSWDINLGGTTANLVGNGDNLSAVGSTIKLYPCRRDNENICCTVE